MREYLFQLLESSGGELSLETILLRLGVSAVIAAFLFLSYRLSHSGSIYSAKFNVSLASLVVITTTVMIVIGNNIALSLGMVGALSIVRFRTAIKDPMDLLYLFWAITTGITTGAGMYALALVAAVVLIVLIWLFYHKQRSGEIYVAVIHYEGDETGDEIIRAFGKMKYFIKSKTMRGSSTEMAVEVCCKRGNMFFAEQIRGMEHVKDITLIQYNGEYHG